MEASKSFDQIYQEHKQMVYRMALSMLGNVHDAEDVTQEVFIQVHKSIKSYKGGAKLSTWVYRITVRVISKWLAKQTKANTVKAETDIAIQTDSSLNVDLLKALGKLPFDSRLVIGLVLVQGLNYAEAADVLNVPEGSVASRLNTARKRLISLLN